MSRARHKPNLRPGFWRGFRNDDSGAVMVEFAIVVSLFFFLFYILLDFGRLSYTTVLAQKGAQLAARIAVVRPYACPLPEGWTDTHNRGTTTVTPLPRFGTACSASANLCEAVATISCTGVATNATATEIWSRVSALMPPDATIDALEFSYTYDTNLGFLGGPYTPMVTVELNLPDFQFISPLGALAGAAGASNPGNLGNDIQFSSFSVSMPAEDLATGDSG